jgi:predicted transcriptional regulator of viral defense system
MPGKVKVQESRFDKAGDVFKQHGGILRTANAIRAGIHPDTLYRMRDSGILEVVSRGVYRLMENPPLENPDLVTVATRIPCGVICLISALAVHQITTQIPHEVHIALPRGAKEPRLDHPPIKTYRFARKSHSEGVQIHTFDNVRIRIYSPEKTIADCFKFRNKIGLDTVIEAIRLYRERKRIQIDELMGYATICRVEKIIRPYLEALL